jgi:hypothetical protein
MPSLAALIQQTRNMQILRASFVFYFVSTHPISKVTDTEVHSETGRENWYTTLTSIYMTLMSKSIDSQNPLTEQT